MKRLLLSLAIMAMTAAEAMSQCCHCPASGCQSNEGATVYMTREITPQSLVRIFKALGVKPKGRVAIKISTGESNRSNHLRPDFIKPLVDEVGGTLVECNTAYGGSRSTTEAHLKAIAERGYDKIAKVDIMDAEGSMKLPVKDTTHIKYNLVGSHMANYDFMINLAHFKGHQMGGFGGVLKNQSIGIASAQGKAYIHTAGYQKQLEGMWQHVGDQDGFLESMAAAAESVHDYFKQDGRNIVYINVMNNMSIDCDCNGNPQHPQIKDYGIMASTDPVALDKACLDVVFNYDSKDGDTAEPLKERIRQLHGTLTVEHSAKIGLGTMIYKIVDIDK